MFTSRVPEASSYLSDCPPGLATVSTAFPLVANGLILVSGLTASADAFTTVSLFRGYGCLTASTELRIATYLFVLM